MSVITANPSIQRDPNIGVSVYYLQDGSAIFGCIGSPEGVISAKSPSIAINSLNGDIYTKSTTDYTNTGWTLISSGGGAGTVTSFSAGNLSPLFNSSVATPTTTPALTFAQISQAANLVYASPSGSAGVPTFRAITTLDLAGVALASPPAASVQFNNGTNGFLGDADFLWDTASGTLQIGKAAVRTGKIQIRSTTSGSIQLTVDVPSSNHNYIFPNALPTTDQVLSAIGVSGVNVTLGWIANPGSVLPGIAQRVAYYPATASQVDDAAGFEYNHSSSQDVFIQAQSTTRLPLTLKAFSSGQTAGYLQCLNESDVFKFGVSYAGGWQAAGDSFFSLTGTDTTFPRRLQLQNIAANTAFRFEGMHEGDGFQQVADGKFQIQNKFGIKFVGTTNSNFSQAYEAGATTDPAVLIQNGLTTVTSLYVNAITSTTAKPFVVGLNLTEIFSIAVNGDVLLADGGKIFWNNAQNPQIRYNSGGDASAILFGVNNTNRAALKSNQFSLCSDGIFSWTNSTSVPNVGQDVFLRKITAASICQGNVNNATPVANLYTLGESSRGGTDSNVGGANGTLQSGLGTGTGTLAQLILRSPIPAASGTTAQAYATGLTIVNGAARLTSYTVATLPAAATAGAGATAFATDALTPAFGATVVGGGAVNIPVYSDGTNWLVG